MNTTIIALALALAPVSTPPAADLEVGDGDNFNLLAYDVASVEITRVEPCGHVLALDSAGHFAGVITICADEAGRLDIEADWPDDLYLSLRHDGGDKPTLETNDASEAIERIDHVLDYLGPADVQAGWGGCLISAATTAASAVSLQFWASVAGAYATACTCTPLLDEEFSEIECPWF